MVQTGEISIIWSCIAFFFFHPCPGPCSVKFTSVSLVVLGSIPIGGVLLQWLSSWARQNFAGWDSSMNISGKVSIFGSAQSAAVLRGGGMWMMCLWIAAYFVVAASLILCALASQFHSRWSLEQERVSTRG